MGLLSLSNLTIYIKKAEFSGFKAYKNDSKTQFFFTKFHLILFWSLVKTSQPNWNK